MITGYQMAVNDFMPRGALKATDGCSRISYEYLPCCEYRRSKKQQMGRNNGSNTLIEEFSLKIPAVQRN